MTALQPARSAARRSSTIRINPADAAGAATLSCPFPPLLQAPGGTLVLAEGAIVTSHHLNRDRDHHAACAAIEPHPGRPGASCCGT